FANGKNYGLGGEPTRSHLHGDSSAREAVDSITRTLLVPKALAPHRDEFNRSFSNLLSMKKIRVYDPGAGGITIGDLRAQLEGYVTGPLGKAKVPIKLWIDARLGGEPHLTVPLTEIKRIHAELSSYISNGRIPEDFAGPSEQSTLMAQGLHAVSVELGDTA